MATRRQKLKYVLESAVASGVTTADLLYQVDAFSSKGGSGIESFLDEQLAGGVSKSTSSVATKQVKDALAYIQLAEDALNAAI